jgi:hypothetical protein
MNPNAKEFVPAHILRKRQDEAASLAKQLGDVDLDESKRVGEVGGETSGDTQQNSKRTSSTSRDKTQTTGTGDSNNRDSANPDKESDPTSTEQHGHKAPNNSYSNQNDERSKNNHETNGEPPEDFDEDDRYLLKAGENYCEFNGEQFIIPGE